MFKELRKEALYMVYVGMDVHRKRTQVAVLDERRLRAGGMAVLS